MKAFLAASLAALSTAAAANPAYVTQGEGVVWMNPYGLCWRTTAWSSGHAKSPCDPVPQAAAPEKISLSADLLFAFNSAVLRDAGKEKLDQLAARLRGTSVEEISRTSAPPAWASPSR